MIDVGYVPISNEEIEEKGPDNSQRPFFIRFLKSYKELLYVYNRLLEKEKIRYSKEDYVIRLENQNKALNIEIDLYKIKVAACRVLFKKAKYKESFVDKLLSHRNKQLLIRFLKKIKSQV